MSSRWVAVFCTHPHVVNHPIERRSTLRIGKEMALDIDLHAR